MQKINVARVCAATFVAFAVCLTAYAEDGYIESEGDAHVSLGCSAGPTTKMEVDFQLTEVTLDTKPFGSWGNNSTIPMFSLYIGNPGNGTKCFSWDCTDANGGRQARNFTVADLKRHIISFDAVTQTYASTNVTDGGAAYSYHFTNGISSLTSRYPLAVFARGADAPASIADHFGGPTKMKVYGVKIYESGVLVRDFTPCLRDGIPGLVDTNRNVFVTGIDVTKVKYGGDILVVKDDPYISTGPYNCATNAYAAGKCIYLETGYTVKPTSRVELDFAPLTPNIARTSYNHAPEFLYAKGPDRNSTKNEMEIVGRTGSTGNLGYKLGYSDYHDLCEKNSKGVFPMSSAYGIRRTLSIGSHTLATITAGWTNSVDTISATWGVETDLTTLPLRLCTANASNNGYAPMKIYGLKIYESGALVKDFKPIVTNGVPGLIDVLDPSNVRYASTYGSGYALTFEAGGDIACTDGSDEAYLEFDGSDERINTGVVVTKDSVIEADLALANAKYPSGSQQVMFVQDGSNGILAWLYINSEFKYSYQFRDFTGSANGINSGVDVSNERRQFKIDGPNAQMTIKRGDEVLYDVSITDGERTRTGGGTTLKIGNAAATMRLYGFKVTTDGNLVRDFVPYVTNGVAGLYDLCGSGFYPLPGGKVRGKGTKGKDEFIVAPQQTFIDIDGSETLSCMAPGAQSYEWFVDGEKIDDETGDTLTLTWDRSKAKMSNHTHTYSVKPVYTVFNETVRGEAAEATVEFKPLGTVITIR